MGLLSVAALAVALSCYSALASGSETAPNSAEGFIRQNTDKALAILSDKSLSGADRNARMEDMMSALLDLKRMALFTLGPVARTASPADITAFVSAYREFALANYTAELGGYMGQTLHVTGAVQRAPGDYIVNAVVVDPTDRADPPAPVNFRVLDEGGGKLALVDASVEGVWFTLAQRDDFAGFLSQNSGDLSKLIVHLKELAAHPQPSSQAVR